MGNLPGPVRLCLLVLPAVLAAALAASSAASAACTLPVADDGGVTPADEVVYQGTLTDDVNQDYLQVPFRVGTGMKGLRIRYCYSNQVPGQADPTLDLGVYGPKRSDAANWTMDDLRGWTGSAIKVAGIGENGYSSVETYGKTPATRKAYIPGRTNRGFTPGPIEPGTWAVELGAGWIPPGGVDFKLGIVQSDDGSVWSNDPFRPDPYSPRVASTKAGWYQGDTHVHGEQEPGNAPIEETLKLAFSPITPGQPKAGAGLDFISLVDHNNTNARGVLGEYTGRYPGKVVIPGVEITTYKGHMNSQNLGKMADFRTNPIWRFPDPEPAPGESVVLDQGDLVAVPGSTEPAALFPEINRLGGWNQLNHPTTWASTPSLCRGCAWSYTDAQTGWADVDSMEIANGIADLSHGAGSPSLNPFTPSAIKLYEERLAAGDHITAVGSSDDHRAGEGFGTGTDPVIGQATTVVYAKKLSPGGIQEGIKAGRTYVKVFGADAPDVILSASTPEGYRGIEGHSLKGRELRLGLKITGTAESSRPGDWSVAVLRDGIQVVRTPITSDSFTTSYRTDRSGRYSFQLIRKQENANVTEAYSTPVWYTNGSVAPPTPKIRSVKLNRKKGIARVKVATIGAGRVVLRRGAVKKAAARSTDTRKVVTLKVVPGTKRLRKRLNRRGKAPVRITFSFSSDWTATRSASKRIVLKKNVKKKAGKRRGKRRMTK